MAIKRIIPISSGKGGVGKTTFAINFSLALSRHGKTVLVDLDTGTSAIRNAIDVPVGKDLYHFFRKGASLNECVTPLDDKLDPQRQFRNFGFVAGPMHLIEEITNFGASHKARLIEAINTLDADYVILDMRAGLDSNVIDFLPFSNSGILIFTPHLPSATLAASDIVKAILFRKLRLIFTKDSPFFSTIADRIDYWRLINDLIDRVEDVYDSSVQNLDAFATDLAENLGDHPITRTVQQTIDEFRVHYVLNLFNGVEDSFNTAVRPFVENLTKNVSAHCGVTNLGWITRSDAIHRANCNKLPAILLPHNVKKEKRDRASQELDDLRVSIGLEPTRKAAPVKARGIAAKSDEQVDPLTRQLDVLKTMFEQKKNDDYFANFDYASQRALFTMKTRRPSEFGDIRIYTPNEMLKTIFAKSNVPTAVDWEELE
ncbi:MAG: Flagellum site-determining protein YlxH [Acidobacteria bacterium]|nr:Flagellum site-determining protein YlxH [Acidobacteriota bacterium]